MNTPTKQGILLVEEVLKDLENPKGSISSALKKLKRASILLNEENVAIWCDIQFGETKYVVVIKKIIDTYLNNEKQKTKETEKAWADLLKELKSLKLEINKNVFSEELSAKSNEHGGGFADIHFIEERYNDFVRMKKGNDGTYYKNNLNNTLSTIKTNAYKLASELHKKFAFGELAESNFEVLKKAVEDVLFDVNFELAEKMLLAFKAVSSNTPEEWSHALTTCRRFLEQLADALFPPTEEKVNGRILGKSQYINRLWAFMDKSIESDTNKEIAKANVDLLGTYMQGLYKISNKGVHAGLTRIEALKAVMHTYLLCADILEYLDKKQFFNKKPNINTASLDELESIGNMSRTLAKEIVKMRVIKGTLSVEDIRTITKITTKSVQSLIDNFSFEK